MDNKQQDSIQVCIRIRPGQEQQSILQFTETQIHLQKNHFGFDKIFPPQSTQEQIFDTVGVRLIARTLDGYNGCIFVYGQTGSGKTYTMMGDGNGLMQKSFVELFMQLEQIEKSECNISCSYYEIYNEQIIDLLDTRKDKKLSIRQDMKKGVFVENMTEQTVYSSVKLLDCLNTGMRNRHVGETMMNRQSSRSHSIFTISFAIKSEVNGCQVLKTPKLHFVDLAGSERQKMTAASGQRLKQAGNINKSLTTLGMVINALASQKSRTHIPYRDSKLTCLLRDSLGGNSKTYLIATVSRNALCFQETLSTLNFANRAKMVKVKAQVNEESLSTNIQTYKQQIKRLKAEISKLKSEKPSPNFNQIRWLSKAQGQNVNYDNQFKEINDKISVISDHLVKNPSPSLQELFEQIKRLKPQRHLNDEQKMIEQKNYQDEDQLDQKMEGQEDQQDPLIQYLSCNNSLLQKIHSKIDQYVQLKSHLRNLAYNNQLTISSLKTPSKFERQQLQGVIEKRNEEIMTLHNQLRQLRDIISEQEGKIQQFACFAKDQANVNEESSEKYQRERGQMQRELCTLKNLVRQANDELQTINKKYLQSQAQYKDTRQLYLYSEQNYQTEKALRDQIQNNLMQKLCQIQQIKQEYTEKMEENKQYFEEVEEGLRQELSVLAQTVEFNQNLVAEYKQKLQQEKQKSHKHLEMVQDLNSKIQISIEEKNKLEVELAMVSQKIKEINVQLESAKKSFTEIVACKDGQIQNLSRQVAELTNKIIDQRVQYEQAQIQYRQQIKNLEQAIQHSERQRQQIIMDHQARVQDIKISYEGQINGLKVAYTEQIERFVASLQQETERASSLSQQLAKTRQRLNELQQKLIKSEQDYAKLQQDTQQKIKRIYEETKARLEQTRVLEIENQQLKKQYKILQKENYKIKSKSSENYSKTQEELALKVDYYQQKFKLMSIEYQKAMQVVKRLKEKEMNQAQKIMTLQETHKAMKISTQSQINGQQSSALKMLSQQNQELRKELENLKSNNQRHESAQSYQNKTSIQQEKTALRQKEDYFRQKILESINRWDPSKENLTKDRSLEQLIHCWQELDAQSCKKIDAIAKGIKREQKLKVQNNLILKQNLYLKEQLAGLQKQGCEPEGLPRKRVKLSLTKIVEDSMQ